MNRREFVTGIIYVVLGIVLLVTSQVMDLGQSTLAAIMPGMGGALIGIGAFRLYRGIRLEKDVDYRENYETEMHDERNAWLRMKAWSWAGYTFVLIACCGTIITAIADKPDLMKYCSFSVCIILVLYWISYLIVRKKY